MPTWADYNKMYRRVLITLFSGYLFCMPQINVYAQSPDVTLSNRTGFYNYNITGPGKASSFYPQGFQYLHESDLRVNNTFGSWKSAFNINSRFTQNKKFDREKASIERLSWKVKNTELQIDVGDYFANLSQYSLNKSIKGIGIQYAPDEHNYYRATFGTFDSQWEYLYKQVAGEPMDRLGGGVRFQHSNNNYRIGLNVAYVADSKGDVNRGTEDAFKQYVPSVDWYFKHNTFSISGESAYGNTTVSPLTSTQRSMVGSAHNVYMRYRIGGLRLSGKFEDVSTSFRTLGGGASPDRLRYFTKADFKLNRDWSLFTLFNQSFNNLSHDPAITSVVVSTGEFGVKRKHFLGRRHLAVSLSLRQKWKRSAQAGAGNKTSRIKAAISDRIAKKFRVRANMERIIGQNNTVAHINRNFYSLDLSSRHRWMDGDLRIRPHVKASFQENDNLTVGGSDTNKVFSVALRGTYKRFLRFGVNTNAGFNSLKSPAQDNVRKTNLRAYLGYKPQWKQPWLKNSGLKFEFTRNNYQFTTSTKNFKENILMLYITSDLNLSKEDSHAHL